MNEDCLVVEAVHIEIVSSWIAGAAKMNLFHAWLGLSQGRVKVG